MPCMHLLVFKQPNKRPVSYRVPEDASPPSMCSSKGSGDDYSSAFVSVIAGASRTTETITSSCRRIPEQKNKGGSRRLLLWVILQTFFLFFSRNIENTVVYFCQRKHLTMITSTKYLCRNQLCLAFCTEYTDISLTNQTPERAPRPGRIGRQSRIRG